MCKWVATRDSIGVHSSRGMSEEFSIVTERLEDFREFARAISRLV